MTEEDFAVAVGRRIKARREELRLAQREVAERLAGPTADYTKLRATHRAYQRWEVGRGTLRHLTEAAEALSTTPDALMGVGAPVALPPDAPLEERVARLEAQVGDLLAAVEGLRQFLSSEERVLAEADALLEDADRSQPDIDGDVSTPRDVGSARRQWRGGELR